jgi:hypothetical protein
MKDDPELLTEQLGPWQTVPWDPDAGGGAALHPTGGALARSRPLGVVLAMCRARRERLTPYRGRPLAADRASPSGLALVAPRGLARVVSQAALVAPRAALGGQRAVFAAPGIPPGRHQRFVLRFRSRSASRTTGG